MARAGASPARGGALAAPGRRRPDPPCRPGAPASARAATTPPAHTHGGAATMPTRASAARTAARPAPARTAAPGCRPSATPRR
ncbi:hypothetical protein AZ18_3397 [Bordetella bronchiseptica D993]|nr:hypothetical protein AZ18_3397 [Bordetella bronchiseptica D993]